MNGTALWPISPFYCSRTERNPSLGRTQVFHPAKSTQAWSPAQKTTPLVSWRAAPNPHWTHGLWIGIRLPPYPAPREVSLFTGCRQRQGSWQSTHSLPHLFKTSYYSTVTHNQRRSASQNWGRVSVTALSEIHVCPWLLSSRQAGYSDGFIRVNS